MKGIAEETQSGVNPQDSSDQYVEVTIEMQEDGGAVQSESVSNFPYHTFFVLEFFMFNSFSFLSDQD